MRVIAEAANGREAIQEFRTHQPDVTLMDLQMREMSGPDAISAIRGEFSEARIIVLTTYSGDVHVIRALKADARGYLMKDVRASLTFSPKGRRATANSTTGWIRDDR
jgi:DNA-binding NarL/FixJ family response regulator